MVLLDSGGHANGGAYAEDVMRENRLRTLINEGKPTFGTRVQSSWPTIIELVGRSQNFDYVEFLAEYAPYDLYALDNMARAIELSPDFTGMIKIERSAQAHIAVRALAAGIQNVLFTDVRTAADAEDCVRTVKPEIPGSNGTHGIDAGRAARAAACPSSSSARGLGHRADDRKERRCRESGGHPVGQRRGHGPVRAVRLRHEHRPRPSSAPASGRGRSVRTHHQDRHQDGCPTRARRSARPRRPSIT